MFGRKKRTPAPKALPHGDFPVLDGMHYLQVFDRVDEILKPDWYLEIRSRSGTSLARRSCNFVGVDPEFAIAADVFSDAAQMHFMQMTSDAFFASKFLPNLGITPDIAFVDGLHHFEYAFRDILNAEATMTPDGVIFVHDVLPFNYHMVSRDYEVGLPWTGDVWKTILALMEARPDLKISMLGAQKTGLAAIQNLDPSNPLIRGDLEDIYDRYRALDLKELGASYYFSRFEIVDPSAFLESLRTR